MELCFQRLEGVDANNKSWGTKTEESGASQRFELSGEHLEAVQEGTADAFAAVTPAPAAPSCAESVAHRLLEDKS